MVRRLFGRDGLDDTSLDDCQLYVQENGRSVNRDIVVEADPAMGRVRAASNFVGAIEGREEPLNVPEEAVKLMRIIDALYASAAAAQPVRV
jgi:predicted dehydrogenase